MSYDSALASSEGVAASNAAALSTDGKYHFYIIRRSHRREATMTSKSVEKIFQIMFYSANMWADFDSHHQKQEH